MQSPVTYLPPVVRYTPRLNGLQQGPVALWCGATSEVTHAILDCAWETV